MDEENNIDQPEENKKRKPGRPKGTEEKVDISYEYRIEITDTDKTSTHIFTTKKTVPQSKTKEERKNIMIDTLISAGEGIEEIYSEE